MQTNHVCSSTWFDFQKTPFGIMELSDTSTLPCVFSLSHFQQHPTLILVEKGGGFVYSEFTKLTFNELNLIVIPAGCINKIEITKKITGTIICFNASSLRLHSFSHISNTFPCIDSENQFILKMDKVCSERIKGIINLMISEFTDAKKDCFSMLHSYLMVLLLEIERRKEKVLAFQYRSVKTEKIMQFEHLIQEHFSQLKLPSEYASILHVSPNYLNKICKESTGLTAGEIIRRKLTLEAKRMLLHSYRNINEIAGVLGFESVSYFITFFKKNTGMTPEKFRNGLI